MCIPWGETRTLLYHCVIVSWLFLLCFCIPSPLWLASIWICPLELREGLGGWSLFPANRKWETQKGFVPRRAPARVLLGFKDTLQKVCIINRELAGCPFSLQYCRHLLEVMHLSKSKDNLWVKPECIHNWGHSKINPMSRGKDKSQEVRKMTQMFSGISGHVFLS